MLNIRAHAVSYGGARSQELRVIFRHIQSDIS